MKLKLCVFTMCAVLSAQMLHAMPRRRLQLPSTFTTTPDMMPAQQQQEPFAFSDLGLQTIPAVTAQQLFFNPLGGFTVVDGPTDPTLVARSAHQAADYLAGTVQQNPDVFVSQAAQEQAQGAAVQAGSAPAQGAEAQQQERWMEFDSGTTIGVVSEEQIDGILAVAVYRNNVDAIRSCIERGANPKVSITLVCNGKIVRGCTLLLFAMLKKNFLAMQELLAYSQVDDIDDTDSLMQALLAGPLVDVNEASGSLDRSPLHQAVFSGDLRLVYVLLQGGADINTQDSKKQTPLHFAVLKGNAEIVAALLRCGADGNASDHHSNTPLHYAAYRGPLEMVQELLLYDYLSRDEYSATPAIPLSLSEETDVLAEIDESVLREAEESDLFGGAHPYVEVNVRNMYCTTPLHLAASRGDLPIVEELLGHGARVDDYSNFGLTALHYAILGGHATVVERLLQAGADTTLQDRDLQTSGMLAGLLGHAEIAGMITAHERQALYRREGIPVSSRQPEHL